MASYLRTRLRRLWHWYIEPFKVRVDYYEHTRIEHRVFPHRLRVSTVESFQERLDRGGMVRVPDGTWHVTESLNVTIPNTSIVGARIQGHF